MNEVKMKNYEFHIDFQANKKINPKIFEEIMTRSMLEYTKEINTTIFIKEWGIRERSGEKPYLEPTNLWEWK